MWAIAKLENAAMPTAEAYFPLGLLNLILGVGGSTCMELMLGIGESTLSLKGMFSSSKPEGSCDPWAVGLMLGVGSLLLEAECSDPCDPFSMSPEEDCVFDGPLLWVDLVS